MVGFVVMLNGVPEGFIISEGKVSKKEVACLVQEFKEELLSANKFNRHLPEGCRYYCFSQEDKIFVEY